jgi:hypothetical protein
MDKNQICCISLQIKAHWSDSFFYWGSDTWQILYLFQCCYNSIKVVLLCVKML